MRGWVPDVSGRLRQRALPDEALGGGLLAQPARSSPASSTAPHARPGFMASFYRAIGYNYCAFMPRAYTRTTLSEAVGRLRPGMSVLLPPGCGEPVALVAEICRQAARLPALTLMGGIHIGDFPFARPEAAPLRVVTWHMSPRLAEAGERVEFVPMRYFDVVTEFNRGGAWAPDCVLVHTAPPDARGYLSLGVSVSVVLPAARRAPLVIAQVNPSMPRTLGTACLHRSQIDGGVEVEEPLVPYPPTPIGD